VTNLLRPLHISPREWLDYLRAHLALVYGVLVVRFRSRGRLLDYEGEVTASELSPQAWVRAAELERALLRALRYGLLRPKCLPRSVALHWMLRRAGLRGSRIRIGVRPEAHGIGAHAWVTLADRVVGDDPQFVSRFSEIADATMAGLA
jgi:Transglutaminase-like superfamily